MKDPEEYREEEEELTSEDGPGYEPEAQTSRVYSHSSDPLPWFPSGFV